MVVKLDNGYKLKDSENIPDEFATKYCTLLFNFFNEKFFGNELYMPKLIFKSDNRCADAFYRDIDVPYPQIMGYYYSRLLDLPHNYPLTFLHEMVHHWVFVNGKSDRYPHNQAFIDKFSSFGIDYHCIRITKSEEKPIPGGAFDKIQPELNELFEREMKMSLSNANWKLFDYLHSLYKARRKLLKERKLRREQKKALAGV